MKFEHSQTYGWEAAFFGLRHPMESYKRADSKFGLTYDEDEAADVADKWIEKEYPEIDRNTFEGDCSFVDLAYAKEEWLANIGKIYEDKNTGYIEYAYLGPNDLDLAQRMIKAGTPNDKFLRQIFLTVDITAPLYW